MKMEYSGTYKNMLPSEVSDDPYCRLCKEHDSDHTIVGTYDPYKQVLKVEYQLCPKSWEKVTECCTGDMAEFEITDINEIEQAALERNAEEKGAVI